METAGPACCCPQLLHRHAGMLPTLVDVKLMRQFPGPASSEALVVLVDLLQQAESGAVGARHGLPISLLRAAGGHQAAGLVLRGGSAGSGSRGCGTCNRTGIRLEVLCEGGVWGQEVGGATTVPLHTCLTLDELLSTRGKRHCLGDSLCLCWCRR